MKLEFDCGYNSEDFTLDFLISLLQNQSNLETLVFGCEKVVERLKDDGVDDMPASRIAKIKTGGIKVIKLKPFNAIEGAPRTSKINRLFDIMLQSCPLLQDFSLDGYMDVIGCIKLDFRGNLFLQGVLRACFR